MTSRTRTSGNLGTSEMRINFVNGGTSGLVETITFPDGQSTMSDVVTPNFRAKLRKGDIINNNCVLKVSDVQMASGSTHYKQKGGSSNPTEYTLDGHVCDYRMRARGVGYLGSGDDGASERRAKLKALANIDSTPYAFGEDIGELGSTFRLIRNPLTSISKLTRSLRRAVKKKRKRRKDLGQVVRNDYYSLSRDIAEVYLQYQFAFSPLVRSVHSAIEAYHYKKPSFPTRLTARGFDSGTSEKSDSVKVSNSLFTRSATSETQHHASILYEVRNPVRGLTWRLGLRAKDLPTTAWQLMPLSFMVDRLIDVQSFSKAIINLGDPKVKILAASITSKVSSSKSMLLTEEEDSGWSRSGTVGPQILEEFTYNRSVWHPSVEDVIPEFTPGELISSATKIADLVALTRVLLMK